MKNFKPCGNQVLIRFVPTKKEEKKTDKGIILLDNDRTTNMNGKQIKVDQMLFQVIGVGEKVNLEEVSFKVGDLVVFNDYDIKYLEDDEGHGYALTKDISIMATYETKQSPAEGWDLNNY